MIPPNILRLMSPEDQERELAAQRKAEARFIAKCEKTEQLLFLKYLKEQRKIGRLYYINPQSNKASTIQPGHPDFTIWGKAQPPLLIEMKVQGGKLSEDQVNAIGELERLEHPVHVCWNHLQAENLVQLYLSVIMSNNDHKHTSIPRTECPGPATAIGQTRT